MTAIGSRRQSRARHQRAAEMRGQGHSWQEIADALGYRSRSGAQQAVERLLSRPWVSTETERELSGERVRQRLKELDAGFRSARRRGDHVAALGYAKEGRMHDERLAILEGLNAPAAPTTLNVNVRQTSIQLLQQLRNVHQRELAAVGKSAEDTFVDVMFEHLEKRLEVGP